MTAISVQELAATFDHTLLRPDSTGDDVRRLCGEAAHYRFATVCVLPCHAGLAVEELSRTGVKVGTVASFPFGADVTGLKAAMVRKAVGSGASEVDVAMNISKFLSGETGYVARELSVLRDEADAAAASNGLDRAILKVIVETAYLSDEAKRLAVRVVAESGADFVKTSTGFGPRGATVEDVALLREEAPGWLKIKASGGIRTLESALEMLGVGAERIGASASPGIMREAEGGGL